MRKTTILSSPIVKALDAVGMTADEFLRSALNIKPDGLLTAEGVLFPEGTAFLAWYKDRAYWAHVRNGALELMGERFASVSSAAGKITHRPTNGWDFWQAKLPGKSDFVKLTTLRAPH